VDTGLRRHDWGQHRRVDHLGAWYHTRFISRKHPPATDSRRRLGAVITWMSSSGSVTPAAVYVQRVFGRIEQNSAGTRDREAAQAGRCYGDCRDVA